MALESCPLAWETVNGITRPALPPCPEGHYLAVAYYEDHPDIQHPEVKHPPDDEHAEEWVTPAWSEPDPRPKLAWYDYQPIPAPPAPTMESRRSEQTQLLAEVRDRIDEATDRGEPTTKLVAYRKTVRLALDGVTDPEAVTWPAKPWEVAPIA